MLFCWSLHACKVSHIPGSAVLEMSVGSCFECLVLKNSPVGHVLRTIGSEQYPIQGCPDTSTSARLFPIPCQSSSPPHSNRCLEHGVLTIAPYATMLRTGRSKHCDLQRGCEIPHPVWFPTSMIGANKSLQGFVMCKSLVNIWFHPLSSVLRNSRSGDSPCCDFGNHVS